MLRTRLVTIALLVLPAAAQAVAPGPRLAEALRVGAARAPGAPQVLRLIVSGPDVDAFAARLAATGIRARRIGPLLRMDTDSAVLGLLGGPERVTIDLGARLRPLLDLSAPAIGVNVDLRSERSGRDVLLAIVDTGIDFDHPDFRNPDGSTRLVAYWDQTAPNDDPAAFGVVCDALDIDEGRCPNRADVPIDDIETQGHGTHVAGIAAGNDARYRGMAPDALLVGVRIRFDEAGLIDGLAWLAELADLYRKPLVVNLSLGANDGSHDGGEASAQVIDALSGPGRVVVAAAGNERDTARLIHAGAAATTAEQRARFKVLSGFAEVTEFHAEIWTDQGAPLEVAFAAEQRGGGTRGEIRGETTFLDVSTLAPEGVTVELTDGGEVAAEVHMAPQTSAVGGIGARLTWRAVDRSLGAYTWHLIWRGGTRRVDAWLTDRVAYWQSESGPTEFAHADGVPRATLLVAGDDQSTLTLPGTARRALTVGAFVTRSRWVNSSGAALDSGHDLGALVDVSSLGPTRDGRLKPDLAAPGEYIASSLSGQFDFVPESMLMDDTHWLQRGTSMAAPHVAGVAALLLQGNPTLTPEALGEALRELAVSDATTGEVPNPAWGWGRLSLRGVAAHPAWSEVMGDTTAPTLYDVAAGSDGDRWWVSWLSDELADSRVMDDEGHVWSRRSFGLRHRFVVAGDPPAEVRVVSADPRGNTSAPRSVLVAPGGCACRLASSHSELPLAPVAAALVFWALIRKRRNSPTWTRGGKTPSAAGLRHSD